MTLIVSIVIYFLILDGSVQGAFCNWKEWNLQPFAWPGIFFTTIMILVLLLYNNISNINNKHNNKCWRCGLCYKTNLVNNRGPIKAVISDTVVLLSVFNCNVLKQSFLKIGQIKTLLYEIPTEPLPPSPRFSPTEFYLEEYRAHKKRSNDTEESFFSTYLPQLLFVSSCLSLLF